MPLINTKSRFFKTAVWCGAGISAAAIVAGVIWGDMKYRNYVLSQEAETVKRLETEFEALESNIAGKRRIEECTEKLLNMNTKYLSNDQMRRRLLMLGDINMYHYNREMDAVARKPFFDTATSYYEQAGEYAGTPGVQSAKIEIIRRVATLYLENGEYQKAIRLIKDNASLKMLPSDRWKLNLIEAECQRQTGNVYAAAQKYMSVADETDNQSFWGEALRKRGDIFVDGLTDKAVLEKLMTRDGTESNPDAMTAGKLDMEKARSILVRTAMEDYRKVIAKLPSAERQVGRCRLGMLRIYVFQQDKTAAYDTVNSIQNSSAGTQEKAEAMVLLARLHESLKEYKEAIKVLDACSVTYPLTTMFVPVSMELYRYYKSSNDWPKAFAISERLISRSPETDIVVELVNDFNPGQSGMLKAIAESDSRDKYISRLKQMLDRLQSNRPDVWKKIQYQAGFIYASILEMTGKYEQAEDEVEKTLIMNLLPPDIADDLLKMDMDLAIKQKKPPVILIARSKRYLARFPSGRFYQEALMNQMDAYFKLELYGLALDSAKKVYVDMMRKNVTTADPKWKKVVAKIGECYDRLGDFNMANRILKENAAAFHEMQSSPDVFITWSNSAVERGQVEEALRRLDVVIPRIMDMGHKAELIVARYLLQLKAGSLNDYAAVKELMEKMTSSQRLSDEQRKKIRRDLYKGLLEYAFKHDTEDVNELVDGAVKDFGSEGWPQYWVLLSLSKYYGTDELRALSRRHEETLRGGMASGAKDIATANFLKKQMELIDKLLKIEDEANKLKTERGL